MALSTPKLCLHVTPPRLTLAGKAPARWRFFLENRCRGLQASIWYKCCCTCCLLGKIHSAWVAHGWWAYHSKDRPKILWRRCLDLYSSWRWNPLERSQVLYPKRPSLVSYSFLMFLCLFTGADEVAWAPHAILTSLKSRFHDRYRRTLYR